MSGAAKKEPDPVGGGTPIPPLVIKDLEKRADYGKEKYGTVLRSHNGRKPLWDAYQEILDCACYLRQAILEQYGE
jgi:hypothetical protein